MEKWCKALGEQTEEAAKLRKGDRGAVMCCSLHFEKDCFNWSKNHRALLKPNAIPTKCLERSSQPVPPSKVYCGVSSKETFVLIASYFPLLSRPSQEPLRTD